MELQSIDISDIIKAHKTKLDKKIIEYHLNVKNRVNNRPSKNYNGDYLDLHYFKK